MNIVSEASVKVAYEVFANDERKEKWMCQSFHNLQWNEEEKSLSHCGINGIRPVNVLLECPFIFCYEMGETKQEVEHYLNEGYSLILPISTEKLGIPGKNYYHNIFVRGIKGSENAQVFDFWPPKYKWVEKKWDIAKLALGIAINQKNYQLPLACKQKDEAWKSDDFMKIKGLAESYLNSNGQQGISIYQYIKRWIEGMENPYTLNHVVFVTLEEHIKIWESIIQGDNNESKVYAELRKQAIGLRCMSMKLWYSKRVNDNWQENIIKRLIDIRDCEEKLLYDVIQNT